MENNIFYKNSFLAVCGWIFLLICLNPVLADNSNTLHAPLKIRNSDLEFTSSNLPIVVIDTYGQTILNNPRIRVHMGIIYNGSGKRNYITDPFNNYNGLINIEIRGSSGQWKRWPKQQYGFETQDSLGQNLNVSLIDMPEENDWILYPPYSDKSLLRNVLAYHLSNAIGRYASRTRFCELFLNGDYRGVYVLMEKIKRDKNRVAISKLRTEDISGDQLTGGYIIKVDRSAGEENAGWVSFYNIDPVFPRPVIYLYHYPRPDDIVPEQRDYIKNFINDFETLMNKNDWESQYKEYLDMDVFIDFWIINEIAKNIDSYSLSTFMYKDRDSKDKRLKMGPVWDFNLGFGNANYYEGEVTEEFILDRKVRLSDKIPFWLKNLDQNEQTRKLFARRWLTYRENELSLEKINQFIDAQVDTLKEASTRNFTRWPILGEYVWPNYFVGETWEEEIEYLKEWIQARTLWIDQQVMLETTAREALAVSFELFNNYPNPFNQSTVISFRLKSPGHIKIELFDVLGREIDQILDAVKPAGKYSVFYNADGLATGLYFCRLQLGRKVFFRKMICLK